MKVLKRVGLVILAVLIIVGSIFLFNQNKDKQQVASEDFYAQFTDAAGKTHEIKVTRAVRGLSNLVNSFAGFESTASAGTFPLTQQVDTAKFTADKRVHFADFVKNVLIPKYGDLVTEASNLTKVPTWMIWGIMLVEINETNLTFSNSTTGAKGPMQIRKITATDTLVVAKRFGNFDKVAHGAILESVLSSTKNANVLAALKANDRSQVIIGNTTLGESKNDLFDPRLNINIGAMKLANLLDIYGENDLASVVCSYNQGDSYAKVKAQTAGKGIEYSLNNVGKEPRKYILSTLGKNGSFDIITNDLGILT